MQAFDVIVVGGGTAGCVLAARLSEDPVRRVLLLEAGGDDRLPEIENPTAWPATLESASDWNYATIPQRVTGRSYPCHRGKVLGGSSSINLMTHIRGHAHDFDRWAELGAEGWDYESVLPFFKRSEHVPDGDPHYRGTGGPLTPRPVENPHPLALAYIDAARLAGHAVVKDLNAASLMGASRQDVLIAGGRRQSTATAYLRPAMGRPNLVVETGAFVRHLTFDGARCTGLGYQMSGTALHAEAAEVILCAGAIDSPRLLLLSGIGAAAELNALGIPVVADLPGVGRNLQDHVLLAGIRYHASKPLPPPSGNLAESTLFMKTDPGQSRPELQIVHVQVDYHTPWQRPVANSFTFGIGHMRPRSRGSISLRDSDPRTAPLIDFDYLSHPDEVAQLISGVEAVHRMTRTDAFEEWGGYSGTDALLSLDRHDLEQTIRDGLSTYFHPAGSCRMGTDALAVVNPQLQVHGIAGLRVADASIMPEIVSSNTAAATIMIAEKAASLFD
ncbi:GMC family oxidoreductase [Sphingosinicella soli]|uniref:Choline dehydrogenase n=1 Tax=Sphingosinicella soli TaxID=333708 RepID=A0A7W7F9E5_9SPHN|nr:GMC family oxidoreductase N-terminal domain-containing protein [Sphingosinicella soli]MBB4632573.1 choline dehydrogenase [Sphingosinicella soli]